MCVCVCGGWGIWNRYNICRMGLSRLSSPNVRWVGGKNTCVLYCARGRRAAWGQFLADRGERQALPCFLLFHHQHHHHQCRHQSVFGRPTIQPACTYCHSFHQFSVFQPTHSLPFQPVLHFFLLQTFSSKSGLYFWISMLLIRYYDLTCGKV